MFQKVNILHFQLAEEKLFSCDNISPSEVETLQAWLNLNIKATEMVNSNSQSYRACGNRFLKDFCFFQSKGTFLSSLIALIYYSYNGNLSTQFSQSLQYKQTFYQLTEEVGIFSACLSYGRIISKKGKGPFQTFPLLINEAIFRMKKIKIRSN